MRMRVIRARDYDEMIALAARVVEDHVASTPNAVLGLATGSTVEGLYERLVRAHDQGSLDLSHVTAFNLDEYVGLPADHEQSFARFMRERLVGPAGMDASRWRIPDGMATDPEAECRSFERALAEAGYPTLQVLGIGGNGHVGFNEPSDAFEDVTHVVALTPETIRANSRFFASEDEVPRKAYTMGIGSIMRSRSLLLLASGEAKAQGIAAALAGPIVPAVPASALRLHPSLTIIADEAALSKLPRD